MTLTPRKITVTVLSLVALAAACGGGTRVTTADTGVDTPPEGSDAPDVDLDLPDLPGQPDGDTDVPTDAPEGSEDGDAVSMNDAPEGSEDSDAVSTPDAAEGSQDGDADSMNDTPEGSDGADAPDAVDTTADVGGCDYLDLDIWIVRCDGGYAYARTFTDLGGRDSCPPYTTVGTSRFPDAPDAYAALDCDPQCEWRAASSVSAMCVDGRRTGWIEYRAIEEACAPVFEFAEGLYPSVEAWNAETNCLAGE